MVIKIYIASSTGSVAIKKHQQDVVGFLEANRINFKEVDITMLEEERLWMYNNIPKDKHPEKGRPVPPQIFNEDRYCGDYEDFFQSKENNTVFAFLGLKPQPSIKSSASWNKHLTFKKLKKPWTLFVLHQSFNLWPNSLFVLKMPNTKTLHSAILHVALRPMSHSFMLVSWQLLLLRRRLREIGCMCCLSKGPHEIACKASAHYSPEISMRACQTQHSVLKRSNADSKCCGFVKKKNKCYICLCYCEVEMYSNYYHCIARLLPHCFKLLHSFVNVVCQHTTYYNKAVPKWGQWPPGGPLRTFREPPKFYLLLKHTQKKSLTPTLYVSV